jgi:translation elongation factor EF-4
LLHLPAWRADLVEVVGEVPVVPIVNKSDLPSNLKAEDLEQVKSSMGADFLFTSAKTGIGVQEAFEGLGRQLLGVSR